MKKNIILQLGCLFVLANMAYSANPSISYVELTDVATHAGTRKSKTTLKIVKRDSVSVNATANVDDGTGSEQVSWTASTGNISGSGLSASWDGSENADINAELDGVPTKASIEINNDAAIEATFNESTSGVKPVIEKITEWLEGSYKKPTFTFGGEIKFKKSKCDYYNDGEKYGLKVEASSSLKVSLPTVKLETPDIPTIIPFLMIKGALKIDTFTLSAGLNGAYDETLNDPWTTPITGSITGETGVAIELTALLGSSDIANVNITAAISSKIESKGVFGKLDKDIRLESAELKIGELKGTISASAEVKILGNWTIKTDLVERTFSSAETFSTDGVKVLYTIS